MKVFRAVKHKINFGNYEGIELSGSIEITSDEFPDVKHEDLMGKASDLLDESMEPDLEEARANLDPDAPFESYAKTWHQEEN